MNDFKSRAAALEPYIEKPWSELPDEVRQLAEGPFSLLAGTGDLPRAERIAIIGNTTTKTLGIWQYSIDDKSSWINVPAGLSDTNAIVIQKVQSGVALRFEAALVDCSVEGKVSVCFNPPEPLTARVWEGDGACEVPEPGTHDISQNVGKAGRWSVETFSIVVDDAGRPKVTGKALTTVGAVWDRLSADQRRAVAHLWDMGHDPASKEEEERAFALVAKASDLENYIAELERTNPTSIEGMVLKRTELERKKEELEQVKAELKKAPDAWREPRQGRGKVGPIKEWLQKTYPNGTPKTAKELARECSKALGISVSDRSIRRAQGGK